MAGNQFLSRVFKKSSSSNKSTNIFAKLLRRSPPIDPQQQQQEKLAEIGSLLCQRRMERDMTLKAIETKTQIPTRLLNAIEKGEMKSLPEPVYIRGLIRLFGDSLGLNGSELANSFPVDLNLKQRRAFFRLRLPSLQLRPFHLYLLYILLVVLSVQGISHVLKQSAYQVAIEPKSQPVVKSSPTNQPKTTATKPAATPKKPLAKPVVVDVKLSDLSWVRITADEKIVFEGDLPKGTQRTWMADRQITIRAGNAGGVLVKFNNEQPKVLGKLGQVENVTYQAKPNPQKKTSG